MKRQALAMGLLLVATVGCEGMGQYDGKVAAENNKRMTARQSAPSITYTEVPHDGRLYVVSTTKAADDIKKGIHPATTITKIGKGPKRETVIFEANKEYVEYALMEEFSKRHGAKVK